MHGLPAERVVVTGAQCYDQWFTRTPERQPRGVLPRDGPARRSAVRAVGALGAQPDARAARAGARGRGGSRRCAPAPTRGCASWACWCGRIPERLKEWAGIDLDALRERGVPRRQPDRSRVTRRLLRLAVPQQRGRRAGDERVSRGGDRRPAGADVHAARVPDAPGGDDPLPVSDSPSAGGLLHTAPDLDDALRGSSPRRVALGGARDERNRRFLGAFVRPAGLDVPATPAFADARRSAGPRRVRSPDPSLGARRVAAARWRWRWPRGRAPASADG